ncbi:MAG: fibronectin type III domain-containing protein [Candidatus Angelobacter sp.]
MRFYSTIAILTLATLLGCGVPGAPQPPSLGIPKFVGDLKALRKGDTVTLTWTTPTETTDGELIRKPGKMLVQRALSSGPNSELHFQTISELPLEPTLKEERGAQVTAKDPLTDVLQSGGNAEFAVYSVLAQGRNEKSFGLPNRASVPLVLTLPAPSNVRAEPVPAGIAIHLDPAWAPKKESRLNVQYVYRIMRKQEGANDAVLVKQLNAGNQAMVFVDDGIEWEKNYQYWITPVTLWHDGSRKGEVEGDDSPAVTLFAHDSFPPAAPSEVQAVYSAVPQQSFIDLTWTPNTEPDLAGYNVYRHVANEAPVKINSELVKTPRFADPGIQPGMKYFYSVSAVDLRGNESGRSEETSETVPKE